jgi:hypothetical protein
MNTDMRKFTKALSLNSGAPSETIESFEQRFQIVFPGDYKHFLSTSNGASGFVGESYLLLWSLDDMEEINQLSNLEEYIPGLILFGSDGGGETYAFDTRQSRLSFVKFPSIGVNSENVEFCGHTFYDFLAHIFKQYQK